MDCCIVIPAYEPEKKLLPYLDQLLAAGANCVLVVDDGSGPAYRAIFDEIEKKVHCTVLRHEENKGKGAAIKTALCRYEALPDKGFGVITADSDGQHTIQDVVKICHALSQQENALVLGCRTFGEGTPQRSAMGNKLTSKAMALLYDIRLQDTQTGLRGIPRALVPAFEKLGGERYEYELNMLIYAKRRCIPFVQIPIATVYFDNNNGSHYRTVSDSLRMIGQLLKGIFQYFRNACISSIVDIAVYSLFVWVLLLALPTAQRLFFSAFASRLASSVVNYAFNRRLPYVQTRKLYPTMLKYYLLWAFQLVMSFSLVWGIYALSGWNEVAIKIMVDLFLGILSYQIQMRWVFRKEEKEEPVLTVQQEQEVG